MMKQKTSRASCTPRIAEVEEILLHTVIVDENDAGTNGISIGCRVTVQDVKSGRELPEYKVVGSQEADPMHRAISEDSPFGKALMGAKRGRRGHGGGPCRHHRLPHRQDRTLSCII